MAITLEEEKKKNVALHEEVHALKLELKIFKELNADDIIQMIPSIDDDNDELKLKMMNILQVRLDDSLENLKERIKKRKENPFERIGLGDF